jgi:hypothetical protein
MRFSSSGEIGGPAAPAARTAIHGNSRGQPNRCQIGWMIRYPAGKLDLVDAFIFARREANRMTVL